MKTFYKWIWLAVSVTGFVVIIHLLVLSCSQYHISNQIILNVVEGSYASFLVVVGFELILQFRFYRRLNLLSGDWEEMKLFERQITDKLGEGKITYNGGNSLSIILTHEDAKCVKRTWKGEAIFDKNYPHFGSISWAYVPDECGEHEFGLKQIIVPTERNKTDKEYLYLYLMPVNHFINLEGNINGNKIQVASVNYNAVVWRKKK